MSHQVKTIFHSLGAMFASTFYYKHLNMIEVYRCLVSQTEGLVEGMLEVNLCPMDGIDQIRKGFEEESKYFDWNQSEIDQLFEEACIEYLQLDTHD